MVFVRQPGRVSLGEEDGIRALPGVCRQDRDEEAFVHQPACVTGEEAFVPQPVCVARRRRRSSPTGVCRPPKSRSDVASDQVLVGASESACATHVVSPMEHNVKIRGEIIRNNLEIGN